MMNYEVVTNKDLEKFTEEYCLNLIKQYEKKNFKNLCFLLFYHFYNI